MRKERSVCYTCLGGGKRELIDIHQYNIGLESETESYLHKLEVVLACKLENTTSRKICKSCIRVLCVSYNFKLMALQSQDNWNKHNTNINGQELADNLNKLCTDEDFEFDADNNGNEQELTSKWNKQSIEDDFRFEIATSGNEQNALSNLKVEIVTQQASNAADTLEILETKFTCLKCEVTLEEFDANHFCTKLLRKSVRLKKRINKPKVFKKASYLENHVKVNPCGSYTCPVCTREYQTSYSLSRHLKTHARSPGTKTKRTPFLCTICGKSFPYSNGVQRHMRVHSGVRNHECNVCLRKFMQSTHLQVHMRTHTGEKPYICDMCGDSFSLKATLDKHLTVHNK